MGTGSGFYDNEMKELGRCPHCHVNVRFQQALVGALQNVIVDIKRPTYMDDGLEPSRTFEFYRCPNCYDVVVWMFTWRSCEADRSLERIYPIRSDHPPAPSGTPPHIARAYEEAAKVLPLSPNAAAALARRAIQLILREVLGVPAGNLQKEIESAGSTLPDWIITALHHLRIVGNFALHPSKDMLSGDVLEAEPQEADLTVALVEALLQHLYAGREAAATLSAAITLKKLGNHK